MTKGGKKMKQRHSWLCALLSILIFVMLPCMGLAAETSGKLEVGGVITDVEDNTTRVNEYVKNRTDDGGSPSLKLDIEGIDDQSAFDLGIDINGSDNFNLKTELDFGRVLRLNIELDSLQHWKDHEDLGYIGATMKPDLEGDQPRLFSDLTIPDPSAPIGVLDTSDPIAQRDGAREHYYQELDNDYIVTRREWENDVDLTLPQLPNLTFHAGMRIETRNGQEQSITSSKCSFCHVSAQGKDISERTEDYTAGVTGKFGRVTVEYEYLNRTFDDNSEDVTYRYQGVPTHSPNGAPDPFFPIDMQENLLYYGGEESYAQTPESEKETHELKARVDIDRNTNIKASYVNSENTSSKAANDVYSLGSDELKTEFESFGGKAATRFGNLRLSVRGNTYEIEADETALTWMPQSVTDGDGTIDSAIIDQTDFTFNDEWTSAEAREVTEFGFDAVYRLMRYTTLRFGYDYEEEDRADEHFGTTETNTFKAAANTRFGKGMNARLSYKFQHIDEPFAAHDAKGIAQNQDELVYTYNENGIVLVSRADAIALNGGGPLLYWDEYGPYGLRTDDGTNQPDEVNEIKGQFSWSVNPQMAATFFMRYRMEENGEVGYEQDTFVPGANLWFAPSSKLNLTMSYTFNKQDTENRMCVGWYHG
jgi:hypothetical protein